MLKIRRILRIFRFIYFNNSNVKEMNGMFCGCSKLKEINGINHFKIKNCHFTSSMFDGCKELNLFNSIL